MILVDRLTKYFGPVMAVNNVSFEVDRGEVVGFLGPNGAGKTTTMRILTGFLPATSGIAKVAGFDIMTESMDVRRSIGYLPESVPLYPEMRVEEYIMFRAKLKGVPRSVRAHRVDYCIDRCRLREVRRRLLGTLSKGYRQRVGLADAMVHDPPIMILDEPTSGLDPVQIRETLSLIRELGEKRTVLLSTHILSEVEAVCSRVIIISAGQVQLNQKLDELESQPVIVVEARGPGEKIAETLRGVAGVSRVVAIEQDGDSDGAAGFEVWTLEDSDLRESLGQAVSAQGFPLRRLERKQRKLEEAFLEVVNKQSA